MFSLSVALREGRESVTCIGQQTGGRLVNINGAFFGEGWGRPLNEMAFYRTLKDTVRNAVAIREDRSSVFFLHR